MITMYRSVRLDIDGDSETDVREQVKSYFGLVEPSQSPQSDEKMYHKSKSALIKFLREFDRQFFGKYNKATGQLDTNVGLNGLKQFIEEWFGEPE